MSSSVAVTTGASRTTGGPHGREGRPANGPHGHHERKSRPGRSAAAVVAASVLVAVLAVAATASGASAGAGSSLSTAPEGMAAYAALLAHYRHRVGVLRAEPSRQAARGSTLVVADPSGFGRTTVAAVASFVRGGGTLVVTGPTGEALLVGLLGKRGAPIWQPGGAGTAFPARGQRLLPGSIAEVAAGNGGTWRPGSGTGAPVLVERTGTGTLMMSAKAGSGRVIALSDPSVLDNSMLARADNAALGLALAGPAKSKVLFDEAVHGYGTGFSALPPRWRLATELGVVAALLWMWSKARRLGPAREVRPPLDPPRSRQVEALSLALARTRDPAGAAAPARAAALGLLARRLGLDKGGAGADPARIRQAAAAARIPTEVVEAVVQPVSDEEDVMEVGRALTWLSR
ncbi:MAG: hypothetical protein M0Z87_10390 [Actinomycetota bacterium]|nr:hypothetical protein [Actinomycetota bacterium]